MKTKLILLALACGFTFAANAQSATDETLKPIAGDKTLEVSLWNSSPAIRMRKFSSETIAFRYSLAASFDNDKYNGGRATRFNVGFAPGVEKHFAGTSRLSPYIGFAVPLVYGYRHYKDEDTEVSNAQSSQPYSGNDRGRVSVGIDGVAGVDFYVARHFYVGIEASVGAAYNSYSDVKVRSNDVAGNNYTLDGYNSFDFSTMSSGGLRVGFVF